jgi:hemoglobin
MTQIMQCSFNNITPEVPPLPSLRLYMVWGEDKIRQLVRYHHFLLQLGEISDFLPHNHEQFEHATRKTADFFVNVFSHVKSTNTPLGYPAMKLRYFNITVDEHARYVWLETYKIAIIDMKMPSECIEEFWSWIEPLSLWMINRHMMAVTPRYYYKDIWEDFADFNMIKKCG